MSKKRISMYYQQVIVMVSSSLIIIHKADKFLADIEHFNSDQVYILCTYMYCFYYSAMTPTERSYEYHSLTKVPHYLGQIYMYVAIRWA